MSNQPQILHEWFGDKLFGRELGFGIFGRDQGCVGLGMSLGFAKMSRPVV